MAIPVYGYATCGTCRKAWAWLDARFTATGNPHHRSGKIRDRFDASTWHFYYLYGLERIATFAKRGCSL